MAFDITNQVDVFKFALPLYDYLNRSGHVEEAQTLDQLVDSCFSDNAQALEAHRLAYRQIKNTVHDLPPQYQHALDAALDVLTEK